MCYNKGISNILQGWRVVREYANDAAFPRDIHVFLVSTIWLYKMLYDAANAVYELYNCYLLSVKVLRTFTNRSTFIRVMKFSQTFLNTSFMTTNSSGVFSLSKSTNIAAVCKSNVKVISKILNCSCNIGYTLEQSSSFLSSGSVLSFSVKAGRRRKPGRDQILAEYER